MNIYFSSIFIIGFLTFANSEYVGRASPKFRNNNFDDNVDFDVATTFPPSTSSIANETEPDTEVEKVRLCTCTESDECIAEAYKSFTACRMSCKSQLGYFGSETDEYVRCFGFNQNGANLINACLKDNIQGFCSNSTTTNNLNIEKPNYFQNVEDEEESSGMEIIKTLKTFHTCAGACLKQHILSCYDRKNCGVVVPENHDIGKVALFCPSLKSTVYATTLKALPCITYRSYFG